MAAPCYRGGRRFAGPEGRTSKVSSWHTPTPGRASTSVRNAFDVANTAQAMFGGVRRSVWTVLCLSWCCNGWRCEAYRPKCAEDPMLVISEVKLGNSALTAAGFVELYNPLPVSVCLDPIELSMERREENQGTVRSTYRFKDCNECNSIMDSCCHTLPAFSYHVVEEKRTGPAGSLCTIVELPVATSPPTNVYLLNSSDASTVDYTTIPDSIPDHWSWARPADGNLECPGLFEPTTRPTPMGFNDFEALSLKESDLERRAMSLLNSFSEGEIDKLFKCGKGKVVPEQLEKGYYTKGKYFAGNWKKGHFIREVRRPRFQFREFEPGFCIWVGDPRQQNAKFIRKPYLQCERGRWRHARFREGSYEDKIEPPSWVRGGVSEAGFYVPENVTMPRYIPSKCEPHEVLTVDKLDIPPPGTGITPYTFLCIWYKLPTPCNVVAGQTTLPQSDTAVREDVFAPIPETTVVPEAVTEGIEGGSIE